MARMSIDDSALRDPRVLRLAKRLGWSRRETLGALLDVWSICYDRASAVIPACDIDTAADRDGFALEMEAVGLASEGPEGVLIRGADGRIDYLHKQAERGAAGGRKRAENAARQREAASTAPSEPPHETQAYASSGGQAVSKPLAPVLVPVPVADPEKNPLSPPAPRARARRAKPSEPTPEELASVRVVLDKLGQRNGVRYQASAEHTRLIVNQLRSGVTEMDLRKVIGYCCTELKWLGKPEMEPYLRPETLFGPKSVHKYLDPARAWWEKIPADANGQKRAGATIHQLPPRDSDRTGKVASAPICGVLASASESDSNTDAPMLDFGDDEAS